jgi:hypothetical protein
MATLNLTAVLKTERDLVIVLSSHQLTCSNGSIRLAQTITVWTCIREEPGSNLRWSTSYLEVFLGRPQSRLPNTATVP